ncbi:ABC transporter permease [Enterococcus sp. AZ072]|uniref:ABC transporter permease n=1 Tax=unclassified Enterococcus TaxID=2608891 RepID=UPI003D2894FC
MKAVTFLFVTNLKQNRYLLLVWVIVLAGLFGAMAFYFNSLFGTQAEIDSIGETMRSPAMVSMFGAFPAEQFKTTAGLLSGMLTVFMGIFMIILNIQLAVNGTRKQEDSGLLELVRSRAVARRAPTSAAILLLIVTNGLLGFLYFGLLQLANLQDANLGGNSVFAALLASAGLMFGVLTVLLAQIANDTRQTYLLSYLIFGVCYLIRMLTDVTDPNLSWFSPLGWLTKAEIYVGNRWLPVFLLLVVTIICGSLALVLVGHRDLDRGLLPERRGRKHGGILMKNPLGLILQMERNMIIGWGIGMLVLGAAYGSVFNSIGDILKINPTYEQVLGVDALHTANEMIILNYVNLLAIIFCLLAVVCGGMILYNLKKHEVKGYLEIIHAKAVSRSKLFFSYYSVAVLAGLICLAAAVLGMALAGRFTLDQAIDQGYFWQTLGVNSLVVITFLSLAAFLVGILPKLISLLWGYLMMGFIGCYFLPLLDFSDNWRKISPLGWTDKVPVGSLSRHWFILMILLTVGLTIVGMIGYNKRDIQGGI